MSTLNLVFIKSKREMLGISLQGMAVKLGFKNSSTYMKYENGTYSLKAEMLPKLAKILKCNINDFFSSDIAKTAMVNKKQEVL